MGMRKEGILGLTWDRVDLNGGFIQLKEADTKTGEWPSNGWRFMEDRTATSRQW